MTINLEQVNKFDTICLKNRKKDRGNVRCLNAERKIVNRRWFITIFLVERSEHGYG